MLLVADVGSTKADWMFSDADDQRQLVSSIGVNPNLHSEAEISTVLQSVCPSSIPQAKVRWVYYYGTGIWDAKRAEKIEKVLAMIYPNANIEVKHDLLGAARAACGASAGIACILGTGSNSCLYDGHKVLDNVTNLGWLLGDEGSGVDLGKRLIRAYSYRELPAEDREIFENATGHNRQSIGDGLYGPSNANRFLASFSPFVHDHLHRPAIKSLVEDAFREFLHRHVLKYEGAKTLPVSFVGSIAYYYREILREVCAAEGIQCQNIRQKPIEALLSFHREQHYPQAVA